jgi:carboxypeptidase C (cathepsin A)
MKTIILPTLLLLGALSAPVADRVKELDQMPEVGKSFEMYSGFLPINGTTKRYHYIAVTSETKKANDPVILWFNGGPGCSSLFGMSMEIGPYVMGDEDTKFRRNLHAWNKEAHVVYIEMPAGVGFSTCDEVENSKSCYNGTDASPLNDDVVANETFMAVRNLFKKFPEWQKNDLYISGESYAGIYVPYLMLKID